MSQSTPVQVALPPGIYTISISKDKQECYVFDASNYGGDLQVSTVTASNTDVKSRLWLISGDGRILDLGSKDYAATTRCPAVGDGVIRQRENYQWIIDVTYDSEKKYWVGSIMTDDGNSLYWVPGSNGIILGDSKVSWNFNRA